MKQWLKALAIIYFTGICLIADAQQRYQFSAQQAVDYALKNNQAVKNALIDIQLQEQINREITAAAYPQINASTGMVYNPSIAVQRFPNFIAAGTYGVLAKEGVKDGSGNTIAIPSDFGFIEAAFGTKFSNTAGVDLQQLLFEGQVFVGLQARRASMEFATKRAEVTEENIKANIYKIYYQLAASNNQIGILNTNIQRLEKQANDTRKMYDNGFAEKLDIDKVTVQLSNLQTEKQKVVVGIENGYLGLKVLMGMPIRDTLVLTESVSYDDVRSGVLDATLYSYSDRAEFQFSEAGKKLNEYNVKRHQLSYYPTVALTSNYTMLRQSENFGFGGNWNPVSQVALRVSVPLFDGFARAARVKKAKLELEQTENRMEELKMTIDREVQLAINSYTNALATLESQRRNMELAEKVYGQTKKKYEIGTGSTTEVTNADADLRISQTNYINALYEAIISKIDFLKATGKL